MNTVSIFEHHVDNQSLLLIKDNNNSLNIQLNTNKTTFYCDECKSECAGNCTCKDKYWVKGIWNGYLFGYHMSDYDELIHNIYAFLKDNFDSILNLNQFEFKTFLKDNENKFLLMYFHDKMLYLLNYTQYLIDLGIFNREFYEKFKLMFATKYKDINSVRIEIVDENINIGISDKVLNIQCEYNSLIDSLTKISFDSICNIQYLSEKLNKESLFIIEHQPLNYITMFIYISAFFSNYHSYSLLREILEDKIENTFFKIYSEIEDVKSILYDILEKHG